MPGVLFQLSSVGAVQLVSQEAKGGSLVSPKVHPFHTGQELRGPHLVDARTCPPWQLPPGPGSVTGLVCTQPSKRALGHSWLMGLLHAPDVLERVKTDPSPSPPVVFFCF